MSCCSDASTFGDDIILLLNTIRCVTRGWEFVNADVENEVASVAMISGWANRRELIPCTVVDAMAWFWLLGVSIGPIV